MVDYTKPTGAGGTMMIRDLGWRVEFWIKAGSTNTWFASSSFSWVIDGSGSGTFSYSTGAAWKLVFARDATYSQNVTFAIPYTGTTGIGGPTSFTQWINRAVVPEPPYGPEIYNIQARQVTVRMYDRGNGGSPIFTRVIGYGKDPNTPIHQMTVDGTGIGTITGLTPGRMYYFWVSVQNAMGWSGWGTRTNARTLGGAFVKVGATWYDALPYVRVNGVWKAATPWGKSGGTWKESS